ncbi:C39 family peptidase [Laspinema olomoucense]|uniref:C39 family peptidase n=1 Tax=Laspinema olomoucense D3b TaxID=2953688 RepID=A0ABT2NAV8_9CYAN|nr:C39 family peptidase [Laspinema sp. D3b]MCT7979834.1 C39 family peptidase [Laspinema sp. D3b]
MKIKFIQNTYLKDTPEPANQLPDDKRVMVKAGTVYDIQSCSKSDSHIKVAFLKQSFNGKNTWFVFGGHVELFDPNAPEKTQKILLPVPWFPQTDNYRDPGRTCNSSSCAMCLEFFKPGTLPGAKGDDKYLEVVFQYGDSPDHDVQTKALKYFGLKSTWYENLSFEDVYKELEAGRPAVIAILHHGTLDAACGGHIIVVCGRTENGDFIVNDPYGSLNDGYQGPVENGKNAVYRKQEMSRRWTVDGPGSGWGRFFPS